MMNMRHYPGCEKVYRVGGPRCPHFVCWVFPMGPWLRVIEAWWCCAPDCVHWTLSGRSCAGQTSEQPAEGHYDIQRTVTLNLNGFIVRLC
ncbi:hypothetical protein AGOR_G00085610 [Albula goreensis]|uniref:Uncharacterized protein n=1 Tax=Albula goreensis TaxID=1534307 RepID=A0A8T3DNV7_9TELE|nr:hypothetical protein AGOR_G00085610 [Albula goreensis]